MPREIAFLYVLPKEKETLSTKFYPKMKSFESKEILGSSKQSRKEADMLWTICVILLILWLLGLISGYTMGGVIHILLVIALVVVVARLIQGRRPL
jgi:hypothetical protein